jgi:serralysin
MPASSNGNDSFQFGPEFGKNIITDFRNGDVIEFDDVFLDFQAMLAVSNQIGRDTVIDMDVGHSITLQRVALGSLDASDFLFV